ncbi:hypothetical protein ABSL23_02120 [Halobacterium sp. NMX12-1]|uniref:Uncharacterized protein n=1 Tax=Halobacterium sp. NMX12-1 TaxID=3166650 RepID=A0AAU8CCH8_9EURY
MGRDLTALAAAATTKYINAEPRVTGMLKRAGVIDATVGHSSRIGVSVPNSGEDDDEQRAAGLAGLLSWCRRLAH